MSTIIPDLLDVDYAPVLESELTLTRSPTHMEVEHHASWPAALRDVAENEIPDPNEALECEKSEIEAIVPPKSEHEAVERQEQEVEEPRQRQEILVPFIDA